MQLGEFAFPFDDQHVIARLEDVERHGFPGRLLEHAHVFGQLESLFHVLAVLVLHLDRDGVVFGVDFGDRRLFLGALVVLGILGIGRESQTDRQPNTTNEASKLRTMSRTSDA